jgi:hypothetical protein
VMLDIGLTRVDLLRTGLWSDHPELTVQPRELNRLRSWLHYWVIQWSVLSGYGGMHHLGYKCMAQCTAGAPVWA